MYQKSQENVENNKIVIERPAPRCCACMLINNMTIYILAGTRDRRFYICSCDLYHGCVLSKQISKESDEKPSWVQQLHTEVDFFLAISGLNLSKLSHFSHKILLQRPSFHAVLCAHVPWALVARVSTNMPHFWVPQVIAVETSALCKCELEVDSRETFSLC